MALEGLEGQNLEYAKNFNEMVDALEAGLLAITMDEARRTRSVVDMTPIWQRFDAALSGTS